MPKKLPKEIEVLPAEPSRGQRFRSFVKRSFSTFKAAFRNRRVLLLLLLASVAVGVGLFLRYREAKRQIALLQNPQEAAKFENQKVIDAVGKLITLPTDETPSIATVTDAAKLKSQSFFQNAQNGDKVLIYSQAKKAILYRPSTNKIIEVGAINLNR